LEAGQGENAQLQKVEDNGQTVLMISKANQ
jgi:hypothetical protein